MSTLLGKKIKEIRLAEGFNQKQFSETCGLVYGTYRNYEASVRQPDVLAIQKICTAFPAYMWFLMQPNMDNAPSGQITPQEKINWDLDSLVKNA